MYGIVYFTDFSSLSQTVYKQQQLQFVHENFHTNRPITSAWIKCYGLSVSCVLYTTTVNSSLRCITNYNFARGLGRVGLEAKHICQPPVIFHSSHTVFLCRIILFNSAADQLVFLVQNPLIEFLTSKLHPDKVSYQTFGSKKSHGGRLASKARAQEICKEYLSKLCTEKRRLEII